MWASIDFEIDHHLVISLPSLAFRYCVPSQIFPNSILAILTILQYWWNCRLQKSFDSPAKDITGRLILNLTKSGKVPSLRDDLASYCVMWIRTASSNQNRDYLCHQRAQTKRIYLFVNLGNMRFFPLNARRVGSWHPEEGHPPWVRQLERFLCASSCREDSSLIYLGKNVSKVW